MGTGATRARDCRVTDHSEPEGRGRQGWMSSQGTPFIITGGETEAQMVHSLSEVTPYRGAPWRPVDDPRLSHMMLS